MFPPFPPMAALPPLLEPGVADVVRIRRVVTKAAGAIGGRQFVYSPWSAAVLCSVKGIKAVDARGQMREHEVVGYEVTFGVDPAVGDRDQLAWDAVGKILTVQGTKLLGDLTTRTWIVYCEEDA